MQNLGCNRRQRFQIDPNVFKAHSALGIHDLEILRPFEELEVQHQEDRITVRSVRCCPLLLSDGHPSGG